MKKFLAVLIFMFTVSAAYAFDIVPKAGFDLDGTFKSDYEVKPGAIAFGAEGRYRISNYFKALAGFDFLPSRSIKNLIDYGTTAYYSGKNFSFLPVYIGVMGYPLGSEGDYNPYVKFDIGYNILFNVDDGNNSSGGMYYSFGFGFELYEKYIAEISSAFCSASDNGEDVSYKKIGLRVGYKFTI